MGSLYAFPLKIDMLKTVHATGSVQFTRSTTSPAPSFVYEIFNLNLSGGYRIVNS
jgi:hypothetical protein